MISLKNIHKYYDIGHNKLHVLKGINLEIEEGEMVAIMGSSGSGKSTLLNILGILDYADEGEYLLDGVKIEKDLSEAKAADYRNKFLGFVFQSFNLISFKCCSTFILPKSKTFRKKCSSNGVFKNGRSR